MHVPSLIYSCAEFGLRVTCLVQLSMRVLCGVLAVYLLSSLVLHQSLTRSFAGLMHDPQMRVQVR